MDDITIPRIKTTEDPSPETNNNLKDEGVLDIPKIEMNKPKPKRRKMTKVLLVFLIALFSLVVIHAILGYVLYTKALALKTSIGDLKEAANSQDLDKMKVSLISSQKSLTEFKGAYTPFKWLKVIPFVGAYVGDGDHAINASVYGLETANLLVEVVDPYADIIGLKGGGQAGSGEQTTQERLDFVVKTIPDLIPKTDSLIAKVKLLRGELDHINPDRYPEKLFGVALRDKLREGIELVDTGSQLVENSKPLLEAAPDILGVNKEQRYMVVFQNDKELRPTGGFITAYSIAKVQNARFEPVLSNDIYNLDSLYTPKIPAPDPIIKYIQGPYLLSKNLRLRDMNWSPDFNESMKLFSNEIKSAGITGIDGIIAVDTQVLVNILNATGPIPVSGYGEFSTKIVPECDCPQVIYELESFADVEGPIVWSENEPGKIVYAPPNYENRKKIIGPLMNSVLANALGQPKEKLPMLFEAIFKSLTEKHVLFYMYDTKSQEAVKTFGIAGTVNDYDGDYLYINDANLGGRKSNLYVTEEVVQDISIAKDGSVTKTLTITYKNPKEQDGWLNSVLPNWVRVYVPKGSTLVDMSGVEAKTEPYDDLGKTVFAGFFKLRPQGVSKVTISYKLPFKVSKTYNLFLQKQPGKDAPLYTLNIGKKSNEFYLEMDKEMKFKI